MPAAWDSDAEFATMQAFRAIVLEASNAVLAAAPADMPRVRDRDLGAHLGSPKCHVCYVFETDAGLASATERKLTDWLVKSTREELLARDYPREFAALCDVSFTTHEEIVRTTGGNYYHYFR